MEIVTALIGGGLSFKMLLRHFFSHETHNHIVYMYATHIYLVLS